MIFKQLRQFHHIAKRHPIAGKNLWRTYGQFFRWQIASRLMPRVSMAMNWRGNLQLWLRRGASAATAQWYFGLSDYEEMSFVLDFLKKDDLFVDVGANIGTFSLLAAGIAQAQTIAIEPSFESADWLRKNAALNNLTDKIELHCIALGASEGSVSMSAVDGQQNHIVGGAVSIEGVQEGVKMTTLDAILRGRKPVLLKIDVEGYEQAVLTGANETLQSIDLQAIIIETMGHSARYGFSESEVDKILRGHGFTPFEYLPPQRQVVPLAHFTDHNTLYLRTAQFEKHRLDLPF